MDGVRYKVKRIMQFRYYGANDKRNYPSDYTTENWTTNVLSKCGVVSHLGIQCEPGVVFYLNDGNNPIAMGSTGIYELDLEGIGRITNLRFDEGMLTSTYPTNEDSSDSKRVLVDVVYDGLEVSE